MKLNEKIYYYRKRAKLSQEELAAQVGVSRQAVSKWELGDATPELDKLAALAKAFGVTADELLREEEPGAEQAGPEETQGRSYPPRTPAYTTSLKTRKWLNRGFKMVVLVRCTVIGLILIIAGGYILVRSLQTLESLPDMGYGGNKMIEDSFGLTSPIGLGAIFMIVSGAISIAAGIVVTAVLSRKEKVRKKDENWTEK